MAFVILLLPLRSHANDRPYHYDELACADLLSVLSWLNERLLHPNPAALELRILEGLIRYNELHEWGLTRTAIHSLAEELLQHENRAMPAIGIINDFLRRYFNPAQKTKLMERIDWSLSEKTFEFDPGQIKFGNLNVTESVRIRTEATAAGRVGAFGSILEIDDAKHQIKIRGNTRLFRILEYDWGFKPLH